MSKSFFLGKKGREGVDFISNMFEDVEVKFEFEQRDKPFIIGEVGLPNLRRCTQLSVESEPYVIVNMLGLDAWSYMRYIFSKYRITSQLYLMSKIDGENNGYIIFHFMPKHMEKDAFYAAFEKFQQQLISFDDFKKLEIIGFMKRNSMMSAMTYDSCGIV